MAADPRHIRVLLVEDYAPNAAACREALEGAGAKVTIAADRDAALSEAGRHAFQALVIDAGLKPGDGVSLLRELDGVGTVRQARVIFLLPPNCPAQLAEAAEAQGDAVLRKPFAARDLARTIEGFRDSAAPPRRNATPRGYDAADSAGGAGRVSEDEDLSGSVIGGCRLERLLGRGGTGCVYFGRHQVLDTPVAVKLLPKQVLQLDPDQLERLVRGARSVARIEHPNVAPVLHAGHEKGYFYVIARYVEGRSLQDILDERGQVSPEEAVRLLKDTAQGLAAAHAAGIIHRDVKPGNIIITPQGDARLTDFGLARPAGTRDVTSSGNIVGTLHYMSPEQCNGEPLDARSDIYSLGATLYRALTGKRPAEADTPLKVLRKQVEEPPQPIATLRSDSPQALNALVERMMSKAPDERPASAEEVVRACRGPLG